jgi:hypothetical protein
MLVRSDRDGLPKALALSLLAVVFLGPIVWPWYETWGIVFLAFVTASWARRLLTGLTAVGCFATIPAHGHFTAGEVTVTIVVLGALTLLAVVSAVGARRQWRVVSSS